MITSVNPGVNVSKIPVETHESTISSSVLIIVFPMNPENRTRVVAVIGCGKFVEGKVGWAIGHSHGLAWRAADAEIRLLAVDPSEENRTAFARCFEVEPADCFSSVGEMYEAVVPDYVSICTWPGLHAPMVIEATARGVKGIACEKPMALNPLEIEQMIGACQKSGAKLAIAHQRRHDAPFQLARKLLMEGVIGEARTITARVGEDWDILSWTVHWFDMANFMFDALPLSILSGIDFQSQRRYGHSIENASVIHASYPGGKEGIFITGPGGEYTFSITGDEGTMLVGDDVRVSGKAERVFKVEESRDASRPDLLKAGGFEVLARELISAVEGNAPMLCSVELGAHPTLMAYAAHESARTCKRVAYPVDFKYAPLEVMQRPMQPWMPDGDVVLFADEHFGGRGREGVFQVFKEAGKNVRNIEASHGLTEKDIEGAGLIVIYHTHNDPSPETRRLLTEWVDARKPLLLLHGAIGAYPKWDKYLEWCGRVWVWEGPNASFHPHEECLLTARTPRFGAFREAWVPNDEVYSNLGVTAPTIDLVDGKIPTGSLPVAWLSDRHPNIGYWMPAHREDLYRLPAVRSGLFEILRLIMI